MRISMRTRIASACGIPFLTCTPESGCLLLAPQGIPFLTAPCPRPAETEAEKIAEIFEFRSRREYVSEVA
jgi:hypothetical protein